MSSLKVSRYLVLLLLLELGVVGLALLDGPVLVHSLNGDGLPGVLGESVLVQVVVLAQLVEEEHQTSVRGDLSQVSKGSSPETQNTVLLDGLLGTIPESVELNIDVGSGGLLVLGLHLLTDGIEGEGQGLGNGTGKATVDEVLPTVQLRTRLAPHVGENLVGHELETSEGNDSENGSGETLVEGEESLLLEDHTEGVEDTLVLGLTIDLHSKTGLDHIQRVHGDGGNDSGAGSSQQGVEAGKSAGVGVHQSLLELTESGEVDGGVGEQSHASNTVTLPESLETLLGVDVLEGSDETSVLLGTDLSDNLDDIERGGESTGGDSSNTSSNEVLSESETAILLLTHNEVRFEKKYDFYSP